MIRRWMERLARLLADRSGNRARRRRMNKIFKDAKRRAKER
jgi:hypothetical protein